MSVRQRKLLGTVLLFLWVIVYALLAMTLLVGVARKLGPVGEPIFYAVAGLAWLPVAMLLIKWMSKP